MSVFLNLLAWSLLLLVALYLVPGMAVLRLLWPHQRASLPLAAHFSLAIGIGVTLPPLLLLLFQQLHLPWNHITTWGYVLVCTLVAVVATPPPRRRFALVLPWGEVRPTFTDGVWLAVVLAVLCVRLSIVPNMPTGQFADSYHHTLIAQLLVDNQGIFHSWQPYAPLTTFTYHFGFHANAAFAHWLTGTGVVDCVVRVGQVLNTITVPMVFLLAFALSSSVWAGVWGAVLVGFASTLPAYFVHWGRYTQLTGQVVLVVVVVCWQQLAEAPTPALSPEQGQPGQRWWGRVVVWGVPDWRLLLLAALTTAAMMLTHYLVTVFAALFVGSYLLAHILAQRSWRTTATVALRALPALVLVLLITSPWIANTLEGYLMRNTTAFVKGEIEAERVASYALIPPIAPLYTKRYILAGAFAGLCLAVWRRQWRVALAAVWGILLVVCIIPQILSLPGTGIIDYLTALGCLYLAVVPLAGYAIVALHAPGGALLRWAGLPRVVGVVVAGVVIAGVGVWGSGWQMRLADGSSQLVTPADMHAMAWIRDNTPPDARFLVNSFPFYGGTMVIGNDGGWWIPLLAGRRSTLPPMTYGSELSEGDYAQQVNTLVATLRGKPLTDLTPVVVDLTTPAALDALRDAGVTYVYRGAHVPQELAYADAIDTTRLHESASFRLVYQAGGVEIFQIVRNKEE